MLLSCVTFVCQHIIASCCAPPETEESQFIAKNPVFSLFDVTGCLVWPPAVQPKVLPACRLANRSCLRSFCADRLTLDPVFSHQIPNFQYYFDQGGLSWTCCLLGASCLGVLAVYALQRLQAGAAAQPGRHGRRVADSAFNTAVSFVTNTNWQGYGGESTMSYLTQMLALAVQNFLSAATGIVVVIALMRGFARHSVQSIGNVWVDLTRVTLWSCCRCRLVFAVVPGRPGRDPEFCRPTRK
jgi:K+-transporting ATPase ATPase A chain